MPLSGDTLFSGKANCNSCHREPLWTEPGWNQHSAAELKIDSFQADRSPGHAYKTMNLLDLAPILRHASRSLKGPPHWTLVFAVLGLLVFFAGCGGEPLGALQRHGGPSCWPFAAADLYRVKLIEQDGPRSNRQA
jgi:hypothetical protein